jgi:hypothetical protein
VKLAMLAAVAVLVLVGCGGSDNASTVTAGSDANACGIDPAKWEAALSAKDPNEAQNMAYDMAESGCLSGQTRAAVKQLLGGDGENYYLGIDSVGLDGLSFEIGYDGERVTQARVIQG